jgi:4-amino-4-deoxy-L-arabinose transferase-like glycosyltransferase
MSLGGAIARPRRRESRIQVPSWTASAWCSLALAVVFVLLTLWWLTQDRGVPYGDASEEMGAAFVYRDHLLNGDLGGIFNYPAYYPPYGLLLGAAFAVVGGVSRIAVVLGHNLVCVPLLVLACYRVGRLTAGPRAGALAVAFALGSPLVIELFHVFMIDTFETTLVALAVWALLESEHFGRVAPAALAGLAVGIGTGTKEQFPMYVAGLVAVATARGGWRNVRGLAVFAGIALLVASPWYVVQADRISALWRAAGRGDGFLFPVSPNARPPLLSTANLGWYGWATLNGLLFAPLAAFAVVGVVSAAWRLREAAARASVVPELLGGLGGSWLLLTLMTHKDMRYALPMIAYLAVLGTAWILRLRLRLRAVATVGLAAAVIATTVGATFGIGGDIPARLPGNLGAPDGIGVPPRGTVVVYANHDYLVSGPRRDADLLAMLRGLERTGLRKVYWDPAAARPEHVDFNGAGLTVLARIAGMSVADRVANEVILPRYVLLMYQPAPPGTHPCVRFSSGMGVWALIGRGAGAVSYCPGHGVTGTPIPVPAIHLADSSAASELR